MSKSKKYNNDKQKGNVYDRIFKENAVSIFIPLIEQELNLKLKSFKALPTKVSKTLEREMDFLYHVISEAEEEFLLHIEFQSRDDPKMVYRMAEYHGLTLIKYRLQIRHVVVYLGEKRSRMQSQLAANQVYDGFELIKLHDLDSTKLLSSQVPEVILLALLGDYKKEQTEAVLRLIVSQLKVACKSPKLLSKYLSQFRILAKLRNLEDLATKILADMPINFNIDVESDVLYLKGIEKGIEKRDAEAKKEMEKRDAEVKKEMEKRDAEAKKEKEASIKDLLRIGLLSNIQIAKAMKVSIKLVKEIKSGLK